MHFIGWLKTKPALEDEAPIFEGPPPDVGAEDDIEAPLNAPAEGEELPDLDDLLTMIEYRSASGEITRRRVTFKTFRRAPSGQPMLIAWCHERQAVRSFRVDRVQCFITIDGEVQAPDVFWAQIDVVPPRYAPPADPAVPPLARASMGDGREDLALRRASRHQVRVLAALSRCDGHFHPAEVEAIVQHAMIEGEDVGIIPTDAGVAAFASYVSRLRPTRDTLAESLSVLFGENANRERLEGRRLQRFWKAANAVAMADEVVAPAEVEFLLELRGLIDAAG